MTTYRIKQVLRPQGSTTTVEWRDWYWPWWTTVTEPNEGGGSHPSVFTDYGDASAFINRQFNQGGSVRYFYIHGN